MADSDKLIDTSIPISMIPTKHQEGETVESVLVDDFLAHYGVRGMKWGVRRQLQKMPSSERAGYLAKKDAKWLAKVEKNPKLDKVSRMAARDAKKQTKQLKAEYKDRGINLKKDRLARTRYDTEVKAILEQSLDRASYRVHKMSPTRLREVQIERHPDGTITAKVALRTNAKITKQQGKIARSDAKRAKKEAKLSHADEVELTDEDFDGLEFFLYVDDEGFVDDILSPFDEVKIEHTTDVDAFLAHYVDDEGFVDDILTPFDDAKIEHATDVDAFLVHYGVKGMKWGVRRSDAELSRAAAARGAVSKVAKATASGAKSAASGAASGAKSAALGAKSAASAAKDKVDDIREKRAVKKEAKELKEEAKALRKEGLGNKSEMSEDSKRLLDVMAKDELARTNADLYAAAQRAQALNNYKKLFSPDPNAELRNAVEALRLEKDYRSLKAELTPQKVSRVSKLMDTAERGFETYQRVDNIMGGKLTAAVTKKMGMEVKPDALEAMKRSNALLSEKATEIRLTNTIRSANASTASSSTPKAPSAPKSTSSSTPRPSTKVPSWQRATYPGRKTPYTTPNSRQMKSLVDQQIKDARDLNSILDDYLK